VAIAELAYSPLPSGLEGAIEMMAPHVYEDARANAPIHVQLWQAGGAHARRDGASVRTHARVVRIFRDREHVLHWGQRISFHVPVMSSNRSDGPALAFMDSFSGDIELVRSQVVAIRHPTLHPVVGPDAKGFLPPGNLR